LRAVSWRAFAGETTANDRRFVTDLVAVYASVARSWSETELADCYRSACERGAADMPDQDAPPASPITLLATAVPRLISLAAAAHLLHALPDTRRDAGLGGELLASIDRTSAGGLHRCHLALLADVRSRAEDANEWLPLTYDQAADWLEHASPTTDPPSLVEHAEQAGRYAALAIGSLDADTPQATEAIADALAHLLFVRAFIDTTGGS
jgi:hypothetical protein